MAIDEFQQPHTAVKIAVVGNINNNMFALARHLRDRQFDAELLFSPAPGLEHFHPKADTFDLEDLAFCREISWLSEGFYGADPAAIRRDMKRYDVVLATNFEAAALSLAGVPIDIYFPYGDDVLNYAHLPDRLSLRQVAEEEVRFFRKRRQLTLRMRNQSQYGHLRRAICTADHVVSDWTNAWWDELMLSLPLQGKVHRTPWPFLYPAPYRSGRSTDVHWRSTIDKLRSSHDLILLYHGRHEWTRAGERNSKNTNHLILGFAEFLQKRQDLRACLVTIEYGHDVAASKALIAELGLSGRTVWFPRMYRKDLMYLAMQADLCCGEFDKSWLTGGTILEALCLGKPLIHHRDDSLYPDVELYPILSAREPGEIAAAIGSYVEDPSAWRARGAEGAAWFDEHVVRRPLDLICQLLTNSAARGDRPAAREAAV